MRPGKTPCVKWYGIHYYGTWASHVQCQRKGIKGNEENCKKTISIWLVPRLESAYLFSYHADTQYEHVGGKQCLCVSVWSNEWVQMIDIHVSITFRYWQMESIIRAVRVGHYWQCKTNGITPSRKDMSHFTSTLVHVSDQTLSSFKSGQGTTHRTRTSHLIYEGRFKV